MRSLLCCLLYTSDYEREKELEWFKINRGYGELIEKMNIKRIMISNVDIPCVVVDKDYIDDKYVPVGRISVLVVDEYDETITYLGVTTNTYGDWTKINNSDKGYEIIKGIMNDMEVMAYYINNNNKNDSE